MRGPAGLLVALSLATGLLAGCADGPAADGSPGAHDGLGRDLMAGRGLIRGRVVDDQNLPVEGARLAIKDTLLQTTSDDAGSFLFVNVEPGTVTVVVSRIGYLGGGKRTLVEADAETQLLLVLLPLLTHERFIDTRGPYKGFMSCGWSTPGVRGIYPSVTYDCGTLGFQDLAPLGPSRNAFLFDLRSVNYHTIIGETRWTTNPGGPSELQTLFSHVGGGGSHWWCAAEGESPIQFVYSQEDELTSCASRGGDRTDPLPVAQMTLVLQTFLPFVEQVDPMQPSPNSAAVDAAVWQSFESFASVFYGDPPPLPYSAFR